MDPGATSVVGPALGSALINGIFYILRTGSPSRDLPERYGPYTIAYNGYNRWAKAGVWLRVFEALASASPQSMQLIDSSIIRAHQHAAGGKKGARHAIGRSRGGLTSKIHVVVDENRLPVRVALTSGQASDKAAAPGLLEGLPASTVVADRGYDWQHLIDLVGQRGGQAHIPTQRDRKVQRSVDPEIYRQRNLVERFFCKLKHFHRVATRYDKLARNFLAAARLWMRVYETTT
ncbi:IS5 family transposase [Rhizobiaceae bacterium LC148]|nr:IS5 family transposase [Rhizobiaceae bacterium LC148]